MPILDDAPTLEVNGQRFYLIGDANYPSITTVLSDDPELQEKIKFFWEDRIMRECLGEALKHPDGKIGFKEFDPSFKQEHAELIESLEDEVQARKAIEMQYTQERGTLLHTYIEHYLADGTEPPQEDPSITDEMTKNVHEKAAMLFYLMREYLDRVGKEGIAEKVLVSPSLKIAGRVDRISDFDGKLSVIDFKGSSKAKRPDERKKWWLQLCFYAVAYEEETGTKIDQLVVIHGQEGTQSIDDGKSQSHLYIEKVDDWYAKLVEAIAEFEERQKQEEFPF